MGGSKQSWRLKPIQIVTMVFGNLHKVTLGLDSGPGGQSWNVMQNENERNFAYHRMALTSTGCS